MPATAARDSQRAEVEHRLQGRHLRLQLGNELLLRRQRGLQLCGSSASTGRRPCAAEVQGGILQCKLVTHRGPWDCCPAGEVDQATPGHTLRIQRRRDAEDEGEHDEQGILVEIGEGDGVRADDAEPPPPPPLQDPLPPRGGRSGEGCFLPRSPALGGSQGEKAGAGLDPRHCAEIFAGLCFPVRPLPLPDARGQGTPGKRCEASVVLPLVQAQAVVVASGKYKGITCRPRMQGGDSRVPGGMLWVRLHPQFGGWSGGLVIGDRDGRVGVCLFGAQQVPQGLA